MCKDYVIGYAISSRDRELALPISQSLIGDLEQAREVLQDESNVQPVVRFTEFTSFENAATARLIYP